MVGYILMEDIMTQGYYFNPYFDWAAYLRAEDPARKSARNSEGEVWESLLAVPAKKDFSTRAYRDRNLLIDDHEVSLAKTVAKLFGTNETPVFLHRMPGYMPPEPFYETLYRGELLAADLEHRPRSETPVLAVIDDGIGFLNERFQVSHGGGYKTRFEAIWLQSLRRDRSGLSPVHFGRVLERAEIDGLVNRPDEHNVYREINETLFDRDTLRMSEQAQSHGTHIMDLAGGTDPHFGDSTMLNLPLLAVQLPPEIVDDTSGTHMVSHILQALRWILVKALDMQAAHVVVNLSFGILAGAKDGNSFFANQVRFTLRLAALLGVRMDLVVPFGNDFENRQVAKVTVSGDSVESLNMVLKPDDRAPSYVEIRSEDGMGSGNILPGLIAPDGTVFAPRSVAPGSHRDIRHRGRVVARIYNIPRRFGRPPNLTLAFAPTRPVLDDDLPQNGTGPLAMTGSWQITLQAPPGTGADIRLEIQRGDTAPGYRERGRQAHLEDPEAGCCAYADQPPVNPVNDKSYRNMTVHDRVTTEGTNSAYTVVTGVDGLFHTVGGAFLGKGETSAVAAQYASFNLRPGRGEPTGGAVSDTNRARPGLRASGVLSGSTARYAGSSAAAAVYSRSLLHPTTPKPSVPANAPGRLSDQVITGTLLRD